MGSGRRLSSRRFSAIPDGVFEFQQQEAALISEAPAMRGPVGVGPRTHHNENGVLSVRRRQSKLRAFAARG